MSDGSGGANMTDEERRRIRELAEQALRRQEAMDRSINLARFGTPEPPSNPYETLQPTGLELPDQDLMPPAGFVGDEDWNPFIEEPEVTGVEPPPRRPAARPETERHEVGQWTYSMEGTDPERRPKKGPRFTAL